MLPFGLESESESVSVSESDNVNEPLLYKMGNKSVNAIEEFARHPLLFTFVNSCQTIILGNIFFDFHFWYTFFAHSKTVKRNFKTFQRSRNLLRYVTI